MNLYLLKKYVVKVPVWDNMLGRNDHPYSQPKMSMRCQDEDAQGAGRRKETEQMEEPVRVGESRQKGSGWQLGSAR